jgi:hypothetical protein
MGAWRPHVAAFVAGNDAPLIDDRAATRGRIAIEDGDEHALPQPPMPNTGTPRGEGRDQDARRWSTHSSASIAANDAPLIGERAAARGLSALANVTHRCFPKLTQAVCGRISKSRSHSSRWQFPRVTGVAFRRLARPGFVNTAPLIVIYP